MIKVADQLPALSATLVDGRNNPVNLTTATGVTFTMVNSSGSVVVNAATATVVNAATGQVAYSWGPSDTATAGTYSGEFEVTFPGGLETFPNARNLQILITPELA